MGCLVVYAMNGKRYLKLRITGTETESWPGVYINLHARFYLQAL